MSFPSEDALTYLPRKPLQEFAKGRVIYDPQHANVHLYVVILGRVKISSTSNEGSQTIGRIVPAEGLFGEACLIGVTGRNETAVALDSVTLMSWSAAEVQQQIEREPRLGLALTQYLIRQCLGMQDRIESMSVCKTPERVMLALLQLAADLGNPLTEGVVRMAALTHHTLAEYVGTSREIVTFQMNRLRRLGLLRYSRQHLDVSTEAMAAILRQQGIHVPHPPSDPAHRAGG